MFIIYGYLLTLVVRCVFSGQNDVNVICESCINGGSKMQGIVGEKLRIKFLINHTKFVDLVVSYNNSVIKITTFNTLIINEIDKKDKKRFSYSSSASYKDDGSRYITITLNSLLLEDNGNNIFSYQYTDPQHTYALVKINVTVNDPVKFCIPPDKTYDINADKEHTVRFTLCGYPKPSKVTATVGSANIFVAETGSTKYRYNYEAKITMNKDQCGDQLTIIAEKASFVSTIKLLFIPGKVSNVNATIQDGINLYVAWKKLEYGSCVVNYIVKHISGGVTKYKYTTENVIIFNDAVGNNSISVYAKVNDKNGDYSVIQNINIETNGTGSTGEEKGDKGIGIGMIILIIIFVVTVIIVIGLLYFKRDKIKQCSQGKVRRDSENDREVQQLRGNETHPNDYEEVRDYVPPEQQQQQRQPPQPTTNNQPPANQQRYPQYQQPSEEQPEQPLIYAELGPGGGRTGQRPVAPESLYATARTEGVHYPELQKSQPAPVVGSGGNRTHPGVSSSNKYDYEPGVVV